MSKSSESSLDDFILHGFQHIQRLSYFIIANFCSCEIPVIFMTSLFLLRRLVSVQVSYFQTLLSICQKWVVSWSHCLCSARTCSFPVSPVFQSLIGESNSLIDIFSLLSSVVIRPTSSSLFGCWLSPFSFWAACLCLIILGLFQLLLLSSLRASIMFRLHHALTAFRPLFVALIVTCCDCNCPPTEGDTFSDGQSSLRYRLLQTFIRQEILDFVQQWRESHQNCVDGQSRDVSVAIVAPPGDHSSYCREVVGGNWNLTGKRNSTLSQIAFHFPATRSTGVVYPRFPAKSSTAVLPCSAQFLHDCSLWSTSTTGDGQDSCVVPVLPPLQQHFQRAISSLNVQTSGPSMYMVSKYFWRSINPLTRLHNSNTSSCILVFKLSFLV